MKRNPLVFAVAIVMLIGLGWLASTWLRSGQPTVAPQQLSPEPSSTAATPEPAAPAEIGDAARTAAPVRSEEEIARPPAPAPVVPPGTAGSIAGRVLNPKAEPVQAAEVELFRGPAMGLTLPSLNAPTGFVAQTDAEGRFKFAGVEPNDDYIVIASHNDYGSCEAAVVVHPGEEKQIADLRLRVGVQIQGTVTSNGRPVSGATVTVSNAMEKIRRFQPAMFKDRLKALDLEPIEERRLTDAQGRYEFETIPFDTFEITAEADGLSRISKTSQGNNLFGGSAREHKIDFELELAATITGRIIDEQGNGIAAAKVSATLANPSLRCESEARSDAGGRFTVERLAPGAYFLAVECEGFTAANRAQVEAGTADLEIELRVQGAVTGVVVDEESNAPIPQFELTVQQTYKGRGPASMRENLPYNDSGGRFEIKNLDPGRYTLLASAVDYADSTSEEFEVVRGQTTPGVRVAMNRGGSVSGKVVDATGKPLKNALIQVRENRLKDSPIHGLFGAMSGRGEKLNQIRSGEDGSFQIDLVVPGTYQILVRHNKFAQVELNDVEIVKSEVKQLGQVELRKGGRVSGHAYDLEGRPLPGATIVALSKANDYRTVRTNNEGYYDLITLPDGDWQVTIQSYVSDKELNPLLQLVYAKNSAQHCQVADGDELTVDLRLSTEKAK